MAIDKLINNLVDDLRPVKPVRSFAARFALLGSFLIAGIAALLALTGLRRNPLGSQAGSIEELLLLALAGVSSWSVLRMSIPGDERPVHRVAPRLLFSGWLILVVGMLLSTAVQQGWGACRPDSHWACAGILVALAGLVSVPVFLLLRRGAVLNPVYCGAMAGLACAASALVGISFICLHEMPAHPFVWHALPAVLVVFLGAAAGHYLLSDHRSEKDI